jgi:hypothetical protein
MAGVPAWLVVSGCCEVGVAGGGVASLAGCATAGDSAAGLVSPANIEVTPCRSTVASLIRCCGASSCSGISAPSGIVGASSAAIWWSSAGASGGAELATGECAAAAGDVGIWAGS